MHALCPHEFHLILASPLPHRPTPRTSSPTNCCSLRQCFPAPSQDMSSTCRTRGHRRRPAADILTQFTGISITAWPVMDCSRPMDATFLDGLDGESAVSGVIGRSLQGALARAMDACAVGSNRNCALGQIRRSQTYFQVMSNPPLRFLTSQTLRDSQCAQAPRRTPRASFLSKQWRRRGTSRLPQCLRSHRSTAVADSTF